MKRGVVLITVLFLLMTVMSGCWSRNEVENLAIVNGIGVDTIKIGDKDMFLLTLDIVQPSLAGGGTEAGGGSQGKPIYWRVTAIGETMQDAERNINMRVPRRVFYGHARYALIGQEAARKGIAEVMDYLHRNNEIRLRTMMLLTDGRAADTLIKFPELEPTIARQVEEMGNVVSRRHSKTEITDLAKLTEAVITPGWDPVVARLDTAVSAPTQPVSEPLEIYRFPGGGILRGDKLVGWLEGSVFRGYMLAVGKAGEGVFPVKLASHPTPDAGVNMTRASGKITVKARGEEVVATIEIRAEGDLGEYHRTAEIATHEGMLLMEKAFAQAIEEEVMKAVVRARELKADIFGFGARLHRSDPKAWKELEKNWHNIFPQVTVRLKIITHLRRTGMISDSYIPR